MGFFTMTNMLPFSVIDYAIVQTFVVYRGRAFSHYEIALALDDGPRTPRLIYVTTDTAIYETALAAEGSALRFDAAWKPGRRQTGQVAQLLTALRIHREAA
jgi:hypothetical protein